MSIAITWQKLRAYNSTASSYLRKVAGIIPFKVFAAHLALLYIIYQVFALLGFLKGYPNNWNLMNWDAWWYSTIRDHGYVYKMSQQCNVAFFPLFPYLWRMLRLNAIGISVVNLCIMLAGFTLLRALLHIKWRDLLLFLSIPSLFFCYVPYSEAIFFLACAILLYGIEKNKTGWAVTGIVMACLSRSAAALLVPGIVAVLVLNYRKENLRKDLVWATALIVSAIGSIGAVQLLQKWQIGYFFKSYEVQKYWGREFSFPEFFLTTWGGQGLVWLDGMAFFIGLVAMVGLIFLLYRKIKNSRKIFNPAFVLTSVYLVLVTFIAISSSPISSEGGTSIFSLNRFIFATPFFPYFIIKLFRHITISFKTVFIFLCLADATGLLFGAFTGTDEWLYWTIVALYGFAWLMMARHQIKREIWLGIYLFNLILQVYLFNCFINGSGTL